MRISIGKVTKELGIKSHMLHMWEKRGWLGLEPVLKDPGNNNQRVYSEEQLEQIKFIQSVMDEQRERGYKRTDIAELEEKLLERYGGEVIPIKEESSLLPSTVEEFHHLMLQNNKLLGDFIEQSKKRDKEMLSKLAEEKADMQYEIKFLKEKLDIAVDYIQKQEGKDVGKKGFWKKLFG